MSCICCAPYGSLIFNPSDNEADCEANPGFEWVELLCEDVPEDFCSGGCIDPFACNYNPAATEGDGSCDYSCQCFPSLQLDGNIPSSAYHSSSIIQSTAVIDSGKTVELFAPDCIHLEIGTSIKAGSTFKADIEDCSE